ncbi:MAG: response regulator [Thermodesulfobacteriota bacterium]
MKNILVVDDEEAILVTMVEWFASAHPNDNYNILVADNGIEAVKSLSSYKIDLLITDLNMPKMDGFELLAHVNNGYPVVPVIVMSAFDTPDIKNKVKKLGVLLFISKPFSTDDLDAIDFEKIFGKTAETEETQAHINGITLQSFLQLINIESKTCTLTIKSKGKKGLIFVDKGDLMNARTGKNEGNKAAQEIISWDNNGLTIEIEHSCSETEKNVDYTIMSLLMEAARMEDERSAKATEKASAPVKPPPPKPVPPAAPVKPAAQAKPAPVTTGAGIDLHKLNLVKVQTMLKEFASLDGFSGAVLATTSGDILQVVRTKSSKVNLEQAAIYANNIMATSHKSTSNIKLDGKVEMVQVDTKAGHMLISGQGGINVMLILANTSSLGLGKIMASRTLGEIMKDLKK